LKRSRLRAGSMLCYQFESSLLFLIQFKSRLLTYIIYQGVVRLFCQLECRMEVYVFYFDSQIQAVAYLTIYWWCITFFHTSIFQTMFVASCMEPRISRCQYLTGRLLEYQATILTLL
jgi:hypothetical protein